MILRARNLVTMTGSPIEDGAVVVKANRVRAAGRLKDIAAHFTGTIVDLGEQTLMPGLINAHCHLDYTMMRRAIDPPKSFTQWVQRINAMKRSIHDDEYIAAITRGFGELKKWGTTTVLNIEAFPELMHKLPVPPIRAWWFYEMIDIRQRLTTDDVMAGASIFFRQHADWIGGFGLSPHAPYTASAALYALANECSLNARMPVTTHVAESAEENSMFRHARGPLYDFMASLGRDMSDCGHGSSLALLIEQNVIGPNWILAHMNELEAPDFELLAHHPLNIVHCPLSHRYFSHRPFAFRKLRELGMNISLGTDSLASNDSLSLFSEMQAVRDTQPWLNAQEILELVTVNPARALNNYEIGHVTPNARADLICVPVTGVAETIYDEIVANQKSIEWMMVDGQIAA
jgi:cytosine/adenosine deaminase-related metal-dependent hydrolase